VRCYSVVAILCLLVVVGTAPALARKVEGEEPVGHELIEAQQALMLGNADEAIRIYLEYLDANPGDVRAFWGLAGAYSAAGRDREDLIPLLEKRIQEEPLDVRARQELGATYARLGDRERAHGLFMDALRQGPRDAGLYAEIGAIEVNHRMFEEAVQVYLEGRRVLGDPTPFSQELTQVYSFLGQYEKAIDECLLAVASEPGLVQWATNRVEKMLADGATTVEVEKKVRAVFEDPKASAPALSFAGSVYLVIGKVDRALAAYERADGLEGRNGDMLLEFAAVLKGNGQLADARDAYRKVAERYRGSRNGATAGIEAARLTAGLGDAAGAVAELQAVAAASGGETEGSEALLEAARIELVTLRDPEMALGTLADLMSADHKKGKQVLEQGRLLEVDACLALGRLDDAASRAEAVLAGSPRDDARELAMYDLGFVSFLKLDLKKALEQLRAMVENDPSGELVNDALRLMLIIADAEETSDPAPVALFASAQADKLAGDGASARGHLAELGRSYPGTPAAVEGLLLEAALSADAGDYPGALETYRVVAADTLHLSARAEAMMRTGDILDEKLGRADEALAEYGAILEKLPPNPISGEARRKIEALRKRAGAEG
jgi:tetratricopeptide (TPR) repeat protein